MALLLLGACGSADGRASPEATTAPTTEGTISEVQRGSAGDRPQGYWHAHDNDIRFERIALEQGLSQSVVNCILQDDQGFLWVGTQDGLNRYDGYEFVVYKRDPYDANSLSDSFVQALYQDQSGVLWIGTGNGGLDSLDPETGRFSHYRHDPQDPGSLSSNQVTAIYQDRDGILWIGTYKGLDRLDPGSEQFVHYRHQPDDPHSPTDGAVQAIYQDDEGSLWIGTSQGLSRWDAENEQFAQVTGGQGPGSLSADSVTSVFQDREQTLWIGTAGGGLCELDRETEQFTCFQNDPDDPQSLGADNVTSIAEDQMGVLWIGTAAGVDRLDRVRQRFVHYRHDPIDPHSLSDGGVQTVFADRSGVLWIGTFGGGLTMTDRWTEQFLHYKHDPDDPHSLGANSVWATYEDEQGIIWIGTANGLDRFSQETGQFIHYENDPANPHSLAAGSVMAILSAGRDTLWVGTIGGLDRFSTVTGRFEHLGGPSVLSLLVDGEGTLWVGTVGGLGRLSRGSGTFTFHVNEADDPTSLSSNTVITLHQDQAGTFWIGTIDGLNRFDPTTGRFTRYLHDPDDPGSISHSTAMTIHEDRSGTLWVGTFGGGLNRFDRETETFGQYWSKDGLASDSIYGILEDSRGLLWISTNGGISRFDPRTETFVNFDVRDGLQSNEFNQGAYCASADGEMFFGGINGLSVFSPGEIQSNPYAPPVVLTMLAQSGEPLRVDRPASAVTDVTIRWPNNFFEFEYAALDYSRPEENHYAFKLEGFDKEWNYVGTRRFGSYTNLPGGTYVLRIKGANGDGVWNEEGISLNLTVVPPFWQTGWFIGLAIVAVIGSALGGAALWIRTDKSQKRQLECKIDERTASLREALTELEQSKEAAETANRAKSVFLANMSHELRTPLNAVLGFTQLMGQDANLTAEQRENLEIINRSGEHLLGLINDVLQLSKIEAGQIALNEQSFDLHRLLDGLEEMFHLRAEEKGLSLVFGRSSDVPQHIRMDQGKLRQVLINLLGNAVKFTEAGGLMLRVDYIPFALGCDKEGRASCSPRLRFEVADTGPGIASEELGSLFTPFEQTTTGQFSQEGTGLGLPICKQFVQLMGGEISISTKMGEGAVFQFELPIALADEGDILSIPPARRVIGLEAGQPTYRLLVAEDDWSNRRLLVKFLKQLGFQVKGAANGQECIDIWSEWSPHLIWMDMRMPVLDGYEAARHIKTTAKGQATTIIALTASAFDEDRKLILSGYCDDYVAKPFRGEMICEKLEKHLGVRFITDDGSPLRLARTEKWRRDVAAVTALKESMAGLPSVLVKDLQQATIQADLDQIADLISHIRDHDASLANALASMAHEFDHDTILELISVPEEYS